MWAEWMEDYDLTVTYEDIRKYEEMKKAKKRKVGTIWDWICI